MAAVPTAKPSNPPPTATLQAATGANRLSWQTISNQDHRGSSLVALAVTIVVCDFRGCRAVIDKLPALVLLRTMPCAKFCTRWNVAEKVTRQQHHCDDHCEACRNYPPSRHFHAIASLQPAILASGRIRPHHVATRLMALHPSSRPTFWSLSVACVLQQFDEWSR